MSATQTREELAQVLHDFEPEQNELVLTKQFADGETVAITFSARSQVERFSEFLSALTSLTGDPLDSLSSSTLKAAAIFVGGQAEVTGAVA